MHIDFIDSTLRDGQQSLWGLNMRAFEAAGALAPLSETGFSTIDLTGPGMFQVLTRDYHDDPWDHLDFLVKSMPGNTFRQGMRIHSAIGFAQTPEAIMELWVQTMVRHGVTEHWIYDVAYDMETFQKMAKTVVDSGGVVIPTIMYGLTSVHGDDFFADRAREMASWEGVDTIEIEDAPGILTPDRARTLLPAIRQAVGGKRLELHCHATTGLGIHNYAEGVKAGIDVLHTASRPMANGPSLPSTEATVAMIEWMGHSHSLDTSKFAAVADNFIEAARIGGHKLGVPAEYDPTMYDHQLPGGMTGSLIRQLGQHGMEHRFPEVVHAIPQVRRDFGEPIMATPMSQFVGIQAVLNVVTGDPYSISPDEIIHYLLGHFGPIYGPVNQEVMDRILSTPRARELMKWERPNPSIKEIRSKFAPGISDEELLLRFLLSQEAVDQALGKGPVRKDPRRSSNAIVENVLDLVADSKASSGFSISSPTFSITLNRSR